MPDTPIDLSEGIQSVRLKVPTAEVPIPPEGFAQLHSPAPGALALRLPDGSVVPVGGGGGGLVDGELQFNGHSIIFHDVEGRHELTLYPEPGSNIKLAGPVTNIGNVPFLPVERAAVLVTSEQLLALDTAPVDVVPSPGAGQWLLPVLVWLRILPGTTPYTLAPAPALVLSVPGHVGAFAWVATGTNGVLDAVDETVATLPPGFNFAPVSWLEDAALVVALDGPVTDGDGVLEVGVLYMVRPAG